MTALGGEQTCKITLVLAWAHPFFFECDCVSVQKSPRSPHVRHEWTREAPWIKGLLNPPSVKAELIAIRQGQAQSGDNPEYCQRIESGQAQAVDKLEYHPKSAWLEGPTVGVNSTSSHPCGDVRILCKEGRLKEALHILNKRGIRADTNTYVCVLQACIKMKGLLEGKQVHAHIIQSGYIPNTFLLNTLINMYAKCGSMVEAHKVFDKIPERDVFTWNVMIGGYAKHGCDREAFQMYDLMQRQVVMPNMVTFTCVLNACASLGILEKGKEVHADIIRSTIVQDVILQNALVNMYAKCGSMKDACQVFNKMAQRDVVSWNAMTTGYTQHGCGREAFEIYEHMQQEGVMPNRVTFTCVLKACASLGALESGRKVHRDIIKAGISLDIILENALINMYADCGSVKEAQQVFSSMAQHDVVSWSAMIAGYAEHECGREAFETYEQMIVEGVTPNEVTFISLLNVCSSLASLEKGIEVHAAIIKAGIVPNAILETALVDMYCKGGSMKNARGVFNGMAKRDLVSWNAMIRGYAQHGCGREVLQLFEKMQWEGLKPNNATFLCLLSACSHVGLVDEGQHYFKAMRHHHGLTPTLEHFGCMVDLLGRAGHLDEAEDFINRMSIEPGAYVWGALLGACRIHGNVEIAEHAAKCLLNCDPEHASTYLLI